MGSCSSTKQTTVVQDNKNENSPPVSTAVSPEQTREEFERKYTQLSSKTIKIEDFQLQRTIAMTTFGRIMLVKRNNQLMSLKIMPKANIIEFGQVKHILSEKSILQAVSFPFIVNFICAFKDNTNLYYAFEYVPGGDMYTQLHILRKYPESQASFYAAQLVLALDYLHNLDIIYRTLKKENILFASDGYIKLFDFEFAKFTKERTYTLCGTPDYLAPEIITGIGQNKGVDYWTLGILIYEMVTSTTPFEAEDPENMYKKIMTGKFDTPDYFSSDLTDLVNKLLQQRAQQRIGCLENGVDDVKKHNWFSSINWDALGQKRVQAPFVPEPDKDYYEKYDEEPLKTAETELYSNEFEEF